MGRMERSHAMRRLLWLLSLLLFCSPLAHAITDYGCGTSGTAQPISMGSGVTIIQCWGNAGNSNTLSYLATGSDGGGLTAGDSLLIFGYQCYPNSGGCASPATSLTYLFVCANSTCSAAGDPIFKTPLYQAGLQGIGPGGGGSQTCGLTNQAGATLYCNYAWYIPSISSTLAAGSVNLVCSSSSSSYVAASNCGYISVFLTEFTGGCTTSSSACYDQGANNSNNSMSATSLTVTSGITRYTNELVCALGGTANDEILSASNGGTIMWAGASGTYSPGNTVFCKIASYYGSAQTLGQTWTGGDIGGTIMVSLKTAVSAPVKLSKWNGVTIGTVSGDISYWNGLASPATAATVNYGLTTQTATDSGNNNLVMATPFITGSDPYGYANEVLNVWWGGSITAGNWGLALYTDSSNAPNTKICSTISTSTPTGGINSLTPTGCGTLSPLTQYWAAAITSQSYENGFTNPAHCPGTSLYSVYVSPGSTTFPSTFGAGTTYNNCYQQYVTVSPQ
jgi:hypothetical protein